MQQTNTTNVFMRVSSDEPSIFSELNSIAGVHQSKYSSNKMLTVNKQTTETQAKDAAWKHQRQPSNKHIAKKSQTALQVMQQPRQEQNHPAKKIQKPSRLVDTIEPDSMVYQLAEPEENAQRILLTTNAKKINTSSLLSQRVQYQKLVKEADKSQVTKEHLEEYYSRRQGGLDLSLSPTKKLDRYAPQQVREIYATGTHQQKVHQLMNKQQQVAATQQKNMKKSSSMSTLRMLRDQAAQDSQKRISFEQQMQLLEQNETPFERKWMRESELLRKQERAMRMYRKRHGEEPEISQEEPCTDINKKEYINRSDINYKKYDVKRLRASIARSSEVKEAMKKPEIKKPRQMSLQYLGGVNQNNFMKRQGPPKNDLAVKNVRAQSRSKFASVYKSVQEISKQQVQGSTDDQPSDYQQNQKLQRLSKILQGMVKVQGHQASIPANKSFDKSTQEDTGTKDTGTTFIPQNAQPVNQSLSVSVSVPSLPKVPSQNFDQDPYQNYLNEQFIPSTRKVTQHTSLNLQKMQQLTTKNLLKRSGSIAEMINQKTPGHIRSISPILPTMVTESSVINQSKISAPVMVNNDLDPTTRSQFHQQALLENRKKHASMTHQKSFDMKSKIVAKPKFLKLQQENAVDGNNLFNKNCEIIRGQKSSLFNSVFRKTTDQKQTSASRFTKQSGDPVAAVNKSDLKHQLSMQKSFSVNSLMKAPQQASSMTNKINIIDDTSISSKEDVAVADKQKITQQVQEYQTIKAISLRADDSTDDQTNIKKFFDKQKQRAFHLSKDHVKKQRQVLKYQHRHLRQQVMRNQSHDKSQDGSQQKNISYRDQQNDEDDDETEIESASSFQSDVRSDTSESSSSQKGSSSEEDYYNERVNSEKSEIEDPTIRAIRKRNRRMMAYKLRIDEKQTQQERIEQLEAPRSKEERLENELTMREYFTHLNKKYITSTSKNPVLVTPSQDIEILDMLPRINMLEDLHFRKALPKSFKLFVRMAPFSDRLDLIRDSKKFIQQLSKDMLRTVIRREEKFFKEWMEEEEMIKDELENIKQEREQRQNENRQEFLRLKPPIASTRQKSSRGSSMPRKIAQSKKSGVSTQQKEQQEVEDFEDNPMTIDEQVDKIVQKVNLVRRKPFTHELIESESLKYSKPLEFKGSVRQQIFGADKTSYPEGLSIYKMLEQMNEKQMLELNQKICNLYEHKLVQERLSYKDQIIANKNPKKKGRELEKVPEENIQQSKAEQNNDLIQEEQSWEGPPLRRRGGHYKFDDDDNNQRELNILANLKSQELKQATKLELLMGEIGTEMIQKAGTVNRRIRHQRGMNIEDRRNLNYIMDLNTRLHKLQPYFDLITAYYWEIMQNEKEKPKKHAKGSNRSKKAATRQTTLATSHRGSISSNHMLSNTQDSSKFTQNMQEQINLQLALASMEQKEKLPQKTSDNKDMQLSSDRYNIIMNQDQAIENINLQTFTNLPDCLRENKIKADRLLFKEAQYFYQKRKTTLQMQVVIDNLQFLMMREILEYTNKTPNEVMNAQKVQKLIDTGRLVAKANYSKKERRKRKELKILAQKAAKEAEKAHEKLMKQIKI